MSMVKIVARSNAGETEKMYNGQTAYLDAKDLPTLKVGVSNHPYVLVKPLRKKCQLVDQIYVRKDCIEVVG